jgi:hypothetical protein
MADKLKDITAKELQRVITSGVFTGVLGAWFVGGLLAAALYLLAASR